MASQIFTDMFAALVSVVNNKIPVIVDLLLRRLIFQLKRPANKIQLFTSVKFIVHLVNQQVVHEIISLQLLTIFLEKSTNDSVEEMELCIMLLECCSQERTYLHYYGYLRQRFFMIYNVYQESVEHFGIRLLNKRLNNLTTRQSFESILPTNKPKDTRFAINFFTSIGLDGITKNLRGYLKNMSRLIMQEQKPVSRSSETDGSSSESESDSERDNHHQRKSIRRT
ncbi:hypothetical protein HAX54_048510 [Datura stramonium]|uniref:Uncharacterized protein n=1 Tax=Datura stramonium TaxID=4076 RepID=A0ABS8WJC7_DATST|nr:hypothetical protein [Datura stramonium]